MKITKYKQNIIIYFIYVECSKICELFNEDSCTCENTCPEQHRCCKNRCVEGIYIYNIY